MRLKGSAEELAVMTMFVTGVSPAMAREMMTPPRRAAAVRTYSRIGAKLLLEIELRRGDRRAG